MSFRPILVCIAFALTLVLANVPAQAGPLSTIREKVKARLHREPTQVQEQDKAPAAKPEHSVVIPPGVDPGPGHFKIAADGSLIWVIDQPRRSARPSAGATVPRQTPAPSSAPTPPKETAARGAAFVREKPCQCQSGGVCTCPNGKCKCARGK